MSSTEGMVNAGGVNWTEIDSSQSRRVDGIDTSLGIRIVLHGLYVHTPIAHAQDTKSGPDPALVWGDYA